jgi:flagellin
VTLYANDTLGDVARKLNEAISIGLGQNVFAADNTLNFSSFVQTATLGTSESVAGTLVIRSVVNGTAGEISIAGDEDLIKALSLNEIQKSKENQFYVSIRDAHNGAPVTSNVKITGNTAYGILDPNIDFEFDATADMETKWNDGMKRYDTSAKNTAFTTTIHVADNTTVFQIGANEGEDMGIDIGDMSSAALGIHKVLVTDRESASRAITIVDNAIDRVSNQRAKLGAYQNRLEHTVSNLTVAGENLTAAESRIRDLDMAKEMMNFTKLNILAQYGSSMLAQANQLPNNILTLLR